MSLATGPRILRPLRHRDYRLLAIGSLVSLFGDGVFLASIAWQVYALRDVPSAMSVVGLIVAGSQVSLLLVGGWASDRFDRRTLLIGADLVRAVAIGGIGVLSVTGALELWHIWVLGALHGMGNAFFNPSATAYVPDLLPEEDLPQANAFLGSARPMMQRLAGPAVGGFVVAMVGPGASFLLDAATFLVSAGMLALIRTRTRPDEVAHAPGHELSGLGEGFRFVWSNRWCWAWLVGAALSVLAFHGPFDVLVPYVLRFDETLGLTDAQAARQYGLILAVGGLGSVCVSLAIGQFDLPRRFVTAMFVAEAVGVGLLAVFGVMTDLWQALLASLVMNGMYAFTDITWTTLLQRRVPRHLLGRVSSIDWLMSLGLVPVSFAVAGPLAERVGARQVLIGGAVLGAGVLLSLLFVRGVRDPERTPAYGPPSPPTGPVVASGAAAGPGGSSRRPSRTADGSGRGPS